MASATPVTFSVLDMTGSTNDVTINIKARNNPTIWNGVFYWLPSTGTNITTTNGVGQINLIPGNYTSVIVGQPHAWSLDVTNSTAPVPATSFTTGVIFYSGVQSLAGSGGIQVSNPAPGQFVIDGSQITGTGGSNADYVLFDKGNTTFVIYTDNGTNPPSLLRFDAGNN